MRAVVTRVSSASVTIEGSVHSRIQSGLLVLLGVGPDDREADAKKLADKIGKLRIFSDEAGKMNRSIDAVGGSLLVISQFTLYADTKSRRPGFSAAAGPELAEALYERFLTFCKDLGLPVQHGVFAAEMQVSSVNDGPVTILLDTKEM